jgi:hypothetical protein
MPEGAPCLPALVHSASSRTEHQEPHRVQLPKQATGPGTIHSADLEEEKLDRPGSLAASALSLALIHRSAWSKYSQNFAIRGFSEVGLPLYGVLRSSCASFVLWSTFP